MATLYAIGAVLLFLITRVSTFPAVYTLLLAFCLCYFPTVALTNAMTMRQVADRYASCVPSDLISHTPLVATSARVDV